jgi:hypothetical protein
LNTAAGGPGGGGSGSHLGDGGGTGVAGAGFDQAAAALTSLIDHYVLPADLHSLAAVMALEELAEDVSNANTALFAKLFVLEM